MQYQSLCANCIKTGRLTGRPCNIFLFESRHKGQELFTLTGLSAQLLGGDTGDLPEIPVKGRERAKAGPGGNGIDGIICSKQFIAGTVDADMMNILQRRHFHAFHENPSEMGLADMAQRSQVVYPDWLLRNQADVVKSRSDDGGICGFGKGGIFPQIPHRQALQC